MEKNKNDIPARQARDENKILLRARHRNYRTAKLTQGVLVTLSVLLPIFGVLVGSHHPQVRPYVALAGLVLLLLETALIDGRQKERIKRGAKLQEQFDTAVFDLPWNRFVAGSRVEPEDVRALSANPLSAAREKHFEAWYEPCVGRLPLHLARLVCQRTNISYDARLRRKYGDALLLLTLTFGIVLSFLGLSTSLKFPELVMTLLVPFMPVLTWALKERLQHASTALSLTNLGSEWDKIWARALDGAGEAQIKNDSRDLQDAIYQHRQRSPLVFDWVYYRLRTSSEDQARHAAEDMVERAETALEEDAKV
ncbi:MULTISPECIES: S-4TM family putative pore-forming effector [Paraburkholderia]|uniref:S-4TM family putative pore-forming effector n=1 Tax=Paraburkholderia TaxID=1822464 RepID=UPI003218C32A